MSSLNMDWVASWLLLSCGSCGSWFLFYALLGTSSLLPAFGTHAAEGPELPVRGLAIAAPSASQLERFIGFIKKELAPRSVNTLILRVDYGFQYASHPKLADSRGLSKDDAKRLADVCHEHGIRVVPQLNLLGHQSWRTRLGNLLRDFPEFDETPWIKLPETYVWPNPDRLYCKSYCTLHPGVHAVVLALVDELCEAFGADAFHAGMDEVFYIGEEQCPRCGGKDKAELFAGEVTRIRNHLAQKGRRLWIWGDRLLDGTTTGLGEWEASLNGTSRAIDLIPKDVTICDWHYERAEPTAAYFALKGFEVVSCPWNRPRVAIAQVADLRRLRVQSSPVIRDRLRGLVQTVWSGPDTFLNELDQSTPAGGSDWDRKSEASCFRAAFEAMNAKP